MPHRVRKVAVVVKDAALRLSLQRRLEHVDRLEVTESLPTATQLLEDGPAAADLFLVDRAALALLRNSARPARVDRDALTPQEQDVLRRLALGLRTTDIALDLGRSPKTVEKHRSSLHRKLGLRSVAQLTAYAIETGLVSVDQVLRRG